MRIRRTVAGVALTTLSAGLLATIPVTAANAAVNHLVISQVYGGGGNSGAPYNADFIEIFNPSGAPLSLNGMSLQYASATGTGNLGANATAITELPNVTLPAGGYFLVQEATGATGSALPPADLVDPSPINMSGTAGKVALVDQPGTLGCNGGSAPCSTAQLSHIVDLVGFGNANFFEGTGAAPTLSNTTSAQRANAGYTDTNVNSADFTAAAPAPRNGSNTAPPPEPDPEPHTIAEVQGAGATSPFDDRKVIVEGVVTGDFQNLGQFGGFFIQSQMPDADPATSDGIRVFNNNTPVSVGDVVTVTGTVDEFASSGLYTGSETQLASATVVTTASGASLPAPVELELPFAQTVNGVAGQERYEGLLVTVPSGLVATDLYTLGQYGEVSLTTDQLLRVPTSFAEADANDADRITLDDGLSGQYLEPMPYTIDGAGAHLPRAGDALAEDVTGVFSYAFGEYRVEPAVGTTAAFTSLNPRTDAPDAVGGDVQVASFNVLNYFTDLATSYTAFPRGANTDEELARQQDKLVSAITGLDADVVGLIEMANDDGDALSTLVTALNEAQPGTEDDYTAVQAPVLNIEPTVLGGTYGTDAIRTAIIYRSSVVTPAGPPPSDPALLNPADPAVPDEPLFDRPPAIQAFTPVGGDREFTVVVNHLKSKGSTNAQCGPSDPFAGNCNALRVRQAEGIVDLLDELGADDALLLGDFNSYEAEQPISVLEDAGFVSAAATFIPTADRYSYSFDGEFGTLDYAFASPSLAGALTGADIWHINSAESPANDYNQVAINSRNQVYEVNQDSLYAGDQFASSDHDPELVGLELVNDAPVADAGGPYAVRVGKEVALDASASSDEEGAPLTYAWDLDGDGAFDDATGPTASFRGNRPPGYYTVAVQVSDGNSTSVDEADVTVTAANGSVPPGRR